MTSCDVTAIMTSRDVIHIRMRSSYTQVFHTPDLGGGRWREVEPPPKSGVFRPRYTTSFCSFYMLLPLFWVFFMCSYRSFCSLYVLLLLFLLFSLFLEVEVLFTYNDKCVIKKVYYSKYSTRRKLGMANTFL